jgi:hypothetical protein
VDGKVEAIGILTDNTETVNNFLGEDGNSKFGRLAEGATHLPKVRCTFSSHQIWDC